MSEITNPELLKRLGIDSSQIDQSQRSSCGKSEPTYWYKEIDYCQKHILSILPMDISHWQIPVETIQKIFDEYTIVYSWRKTRRQLGNCNYGKKRIRINLGYQYHKDESARRKQMQKTLIHEYVHAILYEHYGSNQGHNHRFIFYLRLLIGETYRKGK